VVDFGELSWRTVAVPAEVVVAHSGQARSLSASAYAVRRSEVEAAERALGLPLRHATGGDASALEDPVLRRRARHVTSENARVAAFASALAAGDLPGAGALMSESHASLRDDFEVSTPALDRLVAELSSLPGVYGARLTGAGFGGCAVALAEPGAVTGGAVTGGAVTGGAVTGPRVWVVRPSAGARCEISG
jgi:galactokinase